MKKHYPPILNQPPRYFNKKIRPPNKVSFEGTLRVLLRSSPKVILLWPPPPFYENLEQYSLPPPYTHTHPAYSTPY